MVQGLDLPVVTDELGGLKRVACTAVRPVSHHKLNR